ncbi:MAG: DUF354 domain-containing protein [Candidatus Heimdallarchaeota archaeon]|nr:DUF354 domain-containing protein [Candidatus Heimdallarchaeota archaeon]
MTVNNKIVFVAPYRYLAFPYYKEIIPFLKNKGYKSVFLDSIYDDDIDYDLSIGFDEIYQIENASNIKTSKKNNKLLNNIQKVKQQKKSILSIIKSLKPIAVISSSDLTLNDRIISRWCIKRKIPFMILQAGIVEGTKEKLNKPTLKHRFLYNLFNKILNIPLFRRQKIYGNEEINHTHLLIWSKYFIFNEKRKNIYFIGNPTFDKLFLMFSDKRSIKSKIVICTENIDDLYGIDLFNKIVDIYIEAIRKLPNLFFVIKVHPREPIEKYEKIFNQYQFPNIEIVKEVNLYDLFKECDIQVSVKSGSSLEAAAMGIPVITVVPSELYDQMTDFFQGEINIRVSSAEEFIEAINKLLDINYWPIFLEKRKKYFENIMHSADGQSSKRTADTIVHIIENNRKHFKKIV